MSVPTIPDLCEIEAVEQVLSNHLRSLPRKIVTECLTESLSARIKLNYKRHLEELAREWIHEDPVQHTQGTCEWCDEHRDACKKLEKMGVDLNIV